jgi:hypothetical protein
MMADSFPKQSLIRPKDWTDNDEYEVPLDLSILGEHIPQAPEMPTNALRAINVRGPGDVADQAEEAPVINVDPNSSYAELRCSKPRARVSSL